ncbi:pyridoxamine 5'-phosphate oxidase family protein [Nesterenkonia pannonica]|uniref:pyridoxamine 5'-phosphate oxidase family protein n=1 Tax=Nesterenkonia pannonica TaxID=1548602 RepID=UPI0021644D6E|nr:pyridoxamine 5'-phosphate oxidase family protein [Nesterenkonia pannonica]
MSELNASDLIDRMNDIGTCMFTTVDASGLLVSRPMSISAIDDDHHVWFFTPWTRTRSQRSSEKARSTSRSALTRPGSPWLKTADVVKDEEKREQLKDMGAEAYFSDAADDPRAALLRVTPSRPTTGRAQERPCAWSSSPQPPSAADSPTWATRAQ